MICNGIDVATAAAVVAWLERAYLEFCASVLGTVAFNALEAASLRFWYCFPLLAFLACLRSSSV